MLMKDATFLEYVGEKYVGEIYTPMKGPKPCKTTKTVVDQIINWLDHPETRRAEDADEIGSRDHQLHAGPENPDPPDVVGAGAKLDDSEDWVNILLAVIDGLNRRIDALEQTIKHWTGD